MPKTSEKAKKSDKRGQDEITSGSWKVKKSGKNKVPPKSKNFTKSDSDRILPGPNVPKWWSCRWTLSYIGIIAILLATAINANMWIAIQCMSGSEPVVYKNDTKEKAECLKLEPKQSKRRFVPEFNWSKSFKTNVLAGYFYGYVAGGIPGGVLSDRYGGKRVFCFVLIITSILTILIPPLTRANQYFILFLRVVIGVFSGSLIPAMHSLWGRWAPPVEQTHLTAFCYSGRSLGNLITFLLSGYLCTNGFDNGWASSFYIIGIAGLLFSFFFFYMVYDSPNTHPRISDEEFEFLEAAIHCRDKVPSIPWRRIYESFPLKAIMIVEFCYNWTGYTWLFSLPKIIPTILLLPLWPVILILPYIGHFIGMHIAGPIADIIQQKNWLSTRSTRVLMQSVSLVFCGLTASIFSHIGCLQSKLALALLFLASMFHGLSAGGYIVNVIDIAPSYAGVLIGISNTVGNLPGFLAPLVVTSLTANNLQTEWQSVFYVSLAFSIFGTIYYAIFAKGTIQSWNYHGVAIIKPSDDNY